jgi:hypothetical protein
MIFSRLRLYNLPIFGYAIVIFAAVRSEPVTGGKEIADETT